MISCLMEMKTVMSLSIDITGGATSSIFPNVEALLVNSTDHQRALEYVAARKRMDRYKSMIDFLFCEIHPEWRLSCQRFYAGNGPQLKDQITAKEIEKYDKRLVTAMKVAYKLFCEQRCKSWTSYHKEVEIAFQAAA